MKWQDCFTFRSRCCLLALIVLAVDTVGCSTAKNWRNPLASTTDERKVQREAALSDFEKRRSEVQLKAAQDRLAVGEVDDARRLLNGILQRQPGCRDASLMLAVLLADDDDFAGAEKILLAALRQNSNDAELHHALGTVLELADRLPEAKAHFAQACPLAPANPVFRESLASLTDVKAAQPLIAAAPKPKTEKVAMRISD